MMKFPQRTQEHILEELSERFFQAHLPNNWTKSKPNNDYGVDLVVNIFDDHNASPYEILVQLKSSQHGSKGENEKVKFKISTYNRLYRSINVVMLVKYIAEENEAYWILLVDVPTPNQEQKTFTINVPKENKLSEIKWIEIEEYIREVVDYKLNAGEVIRNKRRSNNV